MDSQIELKRETEFYQGFIRLKMSVSNKAPSVITDVSLDFLFENDLLRIDHYEPPYKRRNGKILLGNINGGTSKSIAVYFDPIMCSRGTEIECQLNYRDAEGRRKSVFMEPKLISVVCPIIKTDLDINVGRLKEFIEKLPSRDSKVYEIQHGFDIEKLSSIAREVVEKHDVRHVRTLKTKDGRAWEIWYYGKTKVTKADIVIRVSISSEKQLLELFAATESAEALTGLLAEVGRGLKHGIEFRASGKGNVINVTIKDSVVQRSNLLDLCGMDGACPVNILVEDSVIQNSGLLSEKEADKRNKEQERKQQEELRGQREEAERKQGEEAERKAREELERRKLEDASKVLTVRETVQNSSQKKVSPKKPSSFSSSSTKPESSSKSKITFFLFLILAIGALVFIFYPFIANPQEIQQVSVSSSSSSSSSSSQDTEGNIPKETAKTNINQTVLSQSPDTYTNSIGMEFVKAPAGEFMMGSLSEEEGRYDDEGPVHKVTIEEPYYLGKYEVTQGQWHEVMGNDPSYFKGDGLPVEQVSWNDVQEFINKLNEMEGTDKYRLPSEAEWEYACRAGTTTGYYFGDDESKLGDYAWYSGYSAYEEWNENLEKVLSEGSTHPVGQKKPNSWGLYDMYGNVWECCQDEYHSNYEGAPSDGSAWEDGDNSCKVSRGSCWSDYEVNCRSARRGCDVPASHNNILGFRVLREI